MLLHLPLHAAVHITFCDGLLTEHDPGLCAIAVASVTHLQQSSHAAIVAVCQLKAVIECWLVLYYRSPMFKIIIAAPDRQQWQCDCCSNSKRSYYTRFNVSLLHPIQLNLQVRQLLHQSTLLSLVLQLLLWT
jgi:hypothetical protein